MQVTCVLLTAAAALTCFLPQSDQFIPIGTISELCCLIDKAENVSAVTSKFFWKLSIFFQTNFAFCRCNSAINFLRDNRDLPNIVRGIWEDIGVRSSQQTTEVRQGTQAPGGGRGGRKSNYPCVNPASKTDIDPAIIQFSTEFHILLLNIHWVCK